MDEATPTPEATPEGPASAGGDFTPDIETELGEAYDRITAEPAEEPAEQPAEDAGQPRDESGRFASKEQEAEPETVEATEETTDQPQSEEQEPSEETPQAIEVPNSWSADVAAKWDDLPPDLQEYIAGREGDSHKQITQQGTELKDYQPIREVIDHFGPMLNGREPAAFVGELFQAAQQLETNPKTAIEYLANAYGVDLAQFVPSQTTDAIDDEWADPAIKQLQTQVSQLGDLLTAQNQTSSAATTQQHQAQVAEAERVVSDFAKDKPHWEAVEAGVGRRIDFLRQTRPYASSETLIEAAYEEEIWANPEVRQAILEDGKAKEAETRKVEAEKKQQQAKTMAAVNVGSETSSQDPIDAISWDNDDALSRLYDKVNAV